MTTSTTKLMAVLAAAAALLIPSAAFAKGQSGNNHSHSSFKISFGGNPPKAFVAPKPVVLLNNNNKCHDSCHDGRCHDRCHDRCYSNYGCGNVYDNFGQAYEPFHSTYTVLPGDTFYTVSLKEYGTSSNSRYVAQFNRMSESAALIPGQTLMLPSISANGALRASRAPAAGTTFPGTFNTTATTSSVSSPAFVAPATFTTPVSLATKVVEQPRTKIVVGSSLLVDGQTFGEKTGAARLRVGGFALPIDVIEWTNSAVKIHLPKAEVTSGTKADIEVVRADGTLASKTAVELVSPSVQVAASK
ncbi:MAG TPA: LysM domain-containing protein [Lacipirellulaceae bacterium]|nr:LysM domain-containing protein [Lacipirellulaceae bacterium]